jgi:hypothetical protein
VETVGADCPVDRSVKARLMDEVLATIKARPEDEGIFTNYLALESKERLLSGRENDSDFLRAAPLSSTDALNLYGHPSTNEDVLVLSGRQDCEPYLCLQEIMVESEVGESFEEKDTITTAGGETSISQASDAFVELGARVGDMSDSAADIINGIDNVIRLNLPSESSIDNFNSRTSINQDNAMSVKTEEESIHTYSASFNCSPDYHQFLQQMFIDETQSLSNFERVYPPLESVANYVKYSDIEKYIFEYYEKQHRRMTVPLHQCRTTASSEAVSFVENSFLSASTTNSSYRSSARPVDRADSWISGNPYIRKPPPPPPPKELRFPTPKQIETATRLSQSKAPRHANLRRGYSGDRVIELTDCTNTLSSNARKDLVKASISPINFEFDMLENITNKSKY